VYRERWSAAAGATVWTRTVSPAGATLRILPDGCLDLIWVDGRLFAVGPDTHAHVVASPPGTSYAAVRFPPGTGPAVLGVPAHELRDLTVPLDALWPDAAVRRLAARIGAAPDPASGLEAAVAARVGRADRVVTAVAGLLRAGRSVAATAEAVGLSERQLHRRCLPAFGYGPKTLARVLRLDRAVALARAGTPFAAVAASTGYADQAHLAREVKAFAGVPLGALM
jgi:AraC-like DNA-binding protein